MFYPGPEYASLRDDCLRIIADFGKVGRDTDPVEDAADDEFSYIPAGVSHISGPQTSADLNTTRTVNNAPPGVNEASRIAPRITPASNLTYVPGSAEEWKLLLQAMASMCQEMRADRLEWQELRSAERNRMQRPNNGVPGHEEGASSSRLHYLSRRFKDSRSKYNGSYDELWEEYRDAYKNTSADQG